MSVPKRDEPGEVRAKNGVVILRCGPEFACALSPDAAVITSDRLFRAGIRAKRQERRLEEPDVDDRDG